MDSKLNIDSSGIDFEPTTDRYGGGFGRIVKCISCGHLYPNPRPTQEVLSQGYSQTVDNHYFEESESRSINAIRSVSTIRNFKQSGDLLEVGCFMGFFLNAARLHFSVSGIELSEWAANYVNNTLKIPVKKCSLLDAKLPAASYDVIVMIEVIEHLPNPDEIIAEVARLLKPGGVLYNVTLNIKGLSSRILGRRWWNLRPAHMHYFYPATFNKLLDKNGFRIVSERSFGKMFTYGYWLSKTKHYSPLLHGIFSKVFDWIGITNKFVYIDTKDSIETVAILKAKS